MATTETTTTTMGDRKADESTFESIRGHFFGGEKYRGYKYKKGRGRERKREKEGEIKNKGRKRKRKNER